MADSEEDGASGGSRGFDDVLASGFDDVLARGLLSLSLGLAHLMWGRVVDIGLRRVDFVERLRRWVRSFREVTDDWGRVEWRRDKETGRTSLYPDLGIRQNAKPFNSCAHNNH